MRKAGFGGQFLTFSVVGIDPLFSALGKEIGGIVISQVVPCLRSTAMPIIRENLNVLNQPTKHRVTEVSKVISQPVALLKA